MKLVFECVTASALRTNDVQYQFMPCSPNNPMSNFTIVAKPYSYHVGFKYEFTIEIGLATERSPIAPKPLELDVAAFLGKDATS